MISISTVYNALKALANDDQKGFVTPYSFNAMASLGQMNVYNEIMSGGFEGTRMTTSRSDVKGASSRLNSNKQHKAFYIEYATLQNTNNNVFDLPANVNKVLTANVDAAPEDLIDGPIRIPVDYNADKIDLFSRRQSGRGHDTAASASELMNCVFVVAGRRAFVGPLSSSDDILISYYRNPGSITESGLTQSIQPSLSFDIVPVQTLDGTVNEYVVNDAASANFDLPTVFLGEVISEMAKLIGVQLEESMVYQYGAAEEQGNEKKQLN